MIRSGGGHPFQLRVYYAKPDGDVMVIDNPDTIDLIHWAQAIAEELGVRELRRL